MAGQAGFFDGEERLQALSAAGDPLERLAQVIAREKSQIVLASGTESCGASPANRMNDSRSISKRFAVIRKLPCRARTGRGAVGRLMTRC